MLRSKSRLISIAPSICSIAACLTGPSGNLLFHAIAEGSFPTAFRGGFFVGHSHRHTWRFFQEDFSESFMHCTAASTLQESRATLPLPPIYLPCTRCNQLARWIRIGSILLSGRSSPTSHEHNDFITSICMPVLQILARQLTVQCPGRLMPFVQYVVCLAIVRAIQQSAASRLQVHPLGSLSICTFSCIVGTVSPAPLSILGGRLLWRAPAQSPALESTLNAWIQEVKSLIVSCRPAYCTCCNAC